MLLLDKAKKGTIRRLIFSGSSALQLPRRFPLTQPVAIQCLRPFYILEFEYSPVLKVCQLSRPCIPFESNPCYQGVLVFKQEMGSPPPPPSDV